MLENIRLSFQGIWSHKMRSFLTMLGIIIGIAAIISIVSTIKGTNEQIKQNLVGSGNNTVEIKLYQNDWEYDATYNGLPQGVPVIGSDTLDSLLEVEGVDSASSMSPEITQKAFTIIIRRLTAEKFTVSTTGIFPPAVIRCRRAADLQTVITKTSARLPFWTRTQPSPSFPEQIRSTKPLRLKANFLPSSASARKPIPSNRSLIPWKTI